MTVEEKAGQLFHTQLAQGPNGTLSLTTLPSSGTDNYVFEKHMSHFNLVGQVNNVRQTAQWYYRLQAYALDSRLDIPVTLSSDPRNSSTEAVGSAIAANKLSAWPQSLGLAALRIAEIVQKFAEVAAAEYKAIGIRSALHPQIDLTTEYLWARIGGTMGEDADLTITKYFPSGGPMEDGEDSHFTYGKNQTYPGKNFEHHLIPFKAAIAAGARQMMPCYSRLIFAVHNGTEIEPAGFSFNKYIVTDLLRGELGFDGIVCSDWGLITDIVIAGQDMPARAWGVEYLSELERVARVLDAGVDQVGGEARLELVVQSVEEGTLSESRIDTSIRHLLREKFALGLSEHPFVDVDEAEQIIENPYFVQLSKEALRSSFTLLTNNGPNLPLRVNSDNSTKVYTDSFNAIYLDSCPLTLVQTIDEADVALVRLQAPCEPRPGGFEANYHAGSREFNATEKARQQAIFEAVPTVVDIYLDRSAVIPEVAERAAALMASYDSSSDTLLDVQDMALSSEQRVSSDHVF